MPPTISGEKAIAALIRSKLWRPHNARIQRNLFLFPKSKGSPGIPISTISLFDTICGHLAHTAQKRPGVKSTVIDPETKELWPGYYMRHFRVSEGPLETIWNDHGECEFALNRGADPKCIVTHNGENIDTYPIIWERLFYRNEFEAVAGSVLQRMVHNFRGYDLVSDEGIERAIEDMTTILVSLDPLITRFEPSGRRNTDETQQDSEGGNLIDESKPE